MKNELEKLSKETLVRKLINIRNITERDYDVETMCEERDRMIRDIEDELQPDINVVNLCRVMSDLDDTELHRAIISKVYTALIDGHTTELNQVLENTFSHYYNENTEHAEHAG